MSALLEVRGLMVEHATPQGRVRAVDGVSFAIDPGEVVGLVGESGSGKSSIARALVGLSPISGGEVRLLDAPLPSKAWPSALRREIQLVFQDPSAALDPRQSVGSAIAEGLQIHRLGSAAEQALTVRALLERVGLEPAHAERRPSELSAGQRQRVVLARALAVRPRVLVLDEPVSALDVSVQAQVLALLGTLFEPARDGWLFISHDLSVVAQVATRVLVLYAGRVVEEGPAQSLLRAPRHPYTQALVASLPPRHPDQREVVPVLQGEPPSPFERLVGCAFHPRCPHAFAKCRVETPSLVDGRACFWEAPR